jgi:hypothetical protein
VTEAVALWSCGNGEYGALGHNDNIDRLIPTRVDPRHFDGVKIITASGGYFVSMSVTEEGVLYTWGTPRWREPGSSLPSPTGLGHASVEVKLVPTHIVTHHIQGARVGRCHSLPPQDALAFAESSKDPSSLVSMLDDNLVQLVVDRCRSWPEGRAGGMEGRGWFDWCGGAGSPLDNSHRSSRRGAEGAGVGVVRAGSEEGSKRRKSTHFRLGSTGRLVNMLHDNLVKMVVVLGRAGGGH